MIPFVGVWNITYLVVMIIFIVRCGDNSVYCSVNKKPTNMSLDI